MIRTAKRLSKKWFLAVALLAAGGFALGSASPAEAARCYGGGYGFGGYGGGYGYAPPVVARRPVVVNYGYPGYGYGGRSSFYRGYGGYGGGFYGGRGISIGFGF